MVKISSNGRITLPKAIRQKHDWHAGTRLIVQETTTGVFLKTEPGFAETKPDHVFGSLPYHGPTKSVDEMNAAIAAGAVRRFRRSR
jgi:AbrB family looped-hinge helix DNA binding protein